MNRIIQSFRGFAHREGDSKDRTFMKFLILMVALSCCLCGIIWSAIYYPIFGLGIITFLPLAFVLVVGSSIIVSHKIKDDRPVIYAQIFCIVFVTAFINWTIGSIDHSGLVIFWAFLGPLVALIFLSNRQGMIWMAIFLGVVFISAAFEPALLGEVKQVSPLVKTLFYCMNIGASSIVVFFSLMFFVKQKQIALELLQKNRELERLNHEQELALKQSEKLATLGRLSAGVAHELNNPSSAIQRGSEQLRKVIPELKSTQFRLGRLGFAESQLQAMEHFNERIREQKGRASKLSSLEKSDREYELESVLEASGIADAWRHAPVLVSIGFEKEDVEELKKQFEPEHMALLLPAFSQVYATDQLLGEIGNGADRMIEIVKALKAYTYMDKAPQQYLDIHEGLENTLVMLHSKLKKGVEVERNYQDSIPQVQGFGSELNQVWTNLIDNAVDAMEGKGKITIRTYQEADAVTVEITDNGPGIPEDIQARVFDPFFTTKPQGKGTGLGLHLSYNIITQKHKGTMRVKSRPGGTTFLVKLPLRLDKSPVNA